MPNPTRPARSPSIDRPIIWPLRPAWRKSVLGVHLVSVGSWIGIEVVLGVLVFTAALTSDPAAAAPAYQVMPLLFWPLLTAGVGALLSGLALGLSSRWGVLRYRWVVTKIAITLVLLTLVALALPSLLDSAAVAGRSLATTGAPGADLGSLFYPPIVSTSALLAAAAISIAKPWGRMRRR